jgi:GNAT superfamily N-acetyltransferase
MDLAARRQASQHAFHRVLGARELDGGLLALVSPQSPDRSILNAVAYDAPDALAERWDALAGLYADAGVRAWTVWVNPGDEALGDVLEQRGHALDARPEAMAATLDEIDLEGEDLGEPVGWAELVALNEAAYGVPEGSFAPLVGLPADVAHLVGVPGRAVVGIHDDGDDAYVIFVATHPDSQGQGLGTALMKQALRAARSRGCVTTTLEASPRGRPVYERLGYRSFGTIQMWEHRTS